MTRKTSFYQGQGIVSEEFGQAHIVRYDLTWHSFEYFEQDLFFPTGKEERESVASKNRIDMLFTA